ncbi:hypothetical protein JGU66_19300 [Myxococcaceae bacterium JPH2]|nr:hypothetical protein [Myxococcaceae bacterium JPH2]
MSADLLGRRVLRHALGLDAPSATMRPAAGITRAVCVFQPVARRGFEGVRTSEAA